MRALAAQSPSLDMIQQLSSRQLEILRLIADGRSNKDIANRLHLTEGTVKQHLIRIFNKLGVSNRTWAASLWHAANGQGEERPQLRAALRGSEPLRLAICRRVTVVTVLAECRAEDCDAEDIAQAFAAHRDRCQGWASVHGGRLTVSQPGVCTVMFGADAALLEGPERAAAFAFALLEEPSPHCRGMQVRLGLASGQHRGSASCLDLTLASLVQHSLRLALEGEVGAATVCHRTAEGLRGRVACELPRVKTTCGGLRLSRAEPAGAAPRFDELERYSLLRESWTRSDGRMRVYAVESWPFSEAAALMRAWSATAQGAGATVRRLYAPSDPSPEAFARALCAQLRGRLEPGETADLSTALAETAGAEPALVFVHGPEALAGYQAWRRADPHEALWTCGLVIMHVRPPGEAATAIRPLTAGGERPLVGRYLEVTDVKHEADAADAPFERQLLLDHIGPQAQAILTALQDVAGATPEHLAQRLRLPAQMVVQVLQALTDYGLAENLDGRRFHAIDATPAEGSCAA